MNILIQNPIEPILEGVTQALYSIGENPIVWTNQPINDVLDRYKPEICFCYDNIQQQLCSKLVIVNHYGMPLTVEPTIICANPINFAKIEQKNIALRIEPAANFAKQVTYYDSKYATDVFYCSQNTTPDILKILYEIDVNYQLKIIGRHRVNIPSYLGYGATDDILKFMASCKIALAFDLDTLYTYASHKVFCVTNQETDLYPSIDQLPEVAKYSSTKIEQIVNQAYTYIVQNHTYLHRAHNIFTRLGYMELAEQCLSTLKNLTKS